MSEQPGSDKDPLIGKQLGDYRLTSMIASGGMARIYKGLDSKLGRQAAVKVLSQRDIQDDKTLAKRFQREARAVAALEHDNIITIYQYGEQEGVYFLAMKLVKGKDLSQELRRLKKSGKKLDVSRGLRILEQVASALDYAHANNVIHRDIKPSNILLDEEKAILTDFGLVMRPSLETTMGTAFGTPRYIAPEQAISSNKALPQSDLYALAVILYEILTGQTPFNGESPMEIAMSHISDAPPKPRSLETSIPEAAEREILKALDKEPEKRHKNATQFIQAVKQAYGLATDATSPSIPSTPPSKSAVTPGNNDMSTPDLRRKESVSAASSVGEISTVAPDVKRRSRRLPLLLLLLILLGGGGFYALTSLGIIGGPRAQVKLVYTDTTLTVVNTSNYPLYTRHLFFARGGDTYAGDRLGKNDTLQAGNCHRIFYVNKPKGDPSPLCRDIETEEGLGRPTAFFWRKETDKKDVLTPTFMVQYKGGNIQTCNTVAEGETGECEFTIPVEPTPTPAQ
jgi:serine/threonine protein kinase